MSNRAQPGSHRTRWSNGGGRLHVALVATTVSVYALIPLLSLPNLVYSGGTTFTVFEALFFSLVVCSISLWGVEVVRTGRLAYTRTELFAVLFVLVCFLTIVQASFYRYEALGWLRQWYAFGALLMSLPLARVVRSERALLVTTAAIVGASTVVSSFVIVVNVPPALLAGSVSQLIDSTGFGSTMHVWGTILLLFGVVWTDDRRVRRVGLLLLCVHLIRLTVGLSRNSILAVGLSGIVLASFYARDRLRISAEKYATAAFGTGLGVVGVMAWVNDYLHVLTVDGIYRALAIRYRLVTLAVSDALENPLVGNGYGYNYREPFVFSMPWNSYVHMTDSVHNLYVYVFSHSGVVGVAVFVLLLLFILRTALPGALAGLAAETPSGTSRGVLFSLLGIFAGLQVFFLLSVRGYQVETQLIVAYVIAASRFFGESGGVEGTTDV